MDKIKREARERQARTGESYTTARRAIATDTATRPGQSTGAGAWTWQQAADRLDALGAMLQHADELREHLTALRALYPPRSLPGWEPMLTSLGLTPFGTPPAGLAAITTEVITKAGDGPLEQAYHWHLRWYAEQAYALLDCAADNRAPIEVPALLPDTEHEWPEEWWAPQDATDVVSRAGGQALSGPVVAALGTISLAQAAAQHLDDWQQDMLDRHLEDGCDEDIEAGCSHGSFGPPEHEIDAWNRCEADAALYQPALAAFCEATRLLIRAHASKTG